MAPLLQFGIVNAALATCLAFLVWLISRRDRRPSLIHLLWILVLVKLVTPPLVRIGVDLPISPRGSSTWQQAAVWLPTVACSAWVCGSLIFIVRQFWLARHFRRLLARATPASYGVQAQARLMAHRLGLARCPPVLLVSEPFPPLLHGLGRQTCLVFPAELMERISIDSRGTLLAHELAHFGRGDHWVRALELAVTALYWWHPVVWWAKRRIEEAEEECCDAWVISDCASSPRIYAEALLETIDFLAETCVPVPAIATGLGEVPQLRQRLRQIMYGAPPRALSGSGRIAILLLAATFLPIHPVFSRARTREVAARPAAAVSSGELRSPTSRIGIRKPSRKETSPGTVVVPRPPA